MKPFLSITLIAILLVASCFTAFGASRSEMLEFMREGNLSMMQVIMRDYPSAWQGGWFNWNHDDDFLAVLPGYVEALASAGHVDDAIRFRDWAIKLYFEKDRYKGGSSDKPRHQDPEWEGYGKYHGRYIQNSFRQTMAAMNTSIERGKEKERLVREQAEAERRAREEAERIAAEKAEAERRAREEAERVAAEKAEAERRAREKAERIAAEKAKAESQRKEKERLAKAKDRIERAKQPLSEKVRDFIVLQRPDIWKQYMALSAAIEDQRKSIDAIATAFREFGRDPENDAKFVEEKNKLLEFEILRGEVREIMETAYLKDVIFRHASGNKNYKATVDNAEVGISELSAISEQFNELMQKK